MNVLKLQRAPSDRARPEIRRFAVVALCAAALAGCGSGFPRHLFTIEAKTSDYPVMVSETARSGGRPIEATSGTAQSGGGNRMEWARSELTASAKLASQVRRNDKWVQIERVEFTATDAVIWPLGASQERHVTVRATVQP